MMEHTTAFPDDSPLFREVQPATRTWAWPVVLLVAAAPWAIVLWQYLGSGVSGLAVTLWLIIGIGLPLFVTCLRLETDVRRDGIRIRFVPLHLHPRRFAFADIAEITPRRYSPIREYGGWGLRLGPSGWAYTMAGDMGIQLRLASGTRILIGTRHAAEFMAAVRSVFPAAGG